MFTSRHAQLKLTTFDVRPRSAAGGYFALFYGYRLRSPIHLFRNEHLAQISGC